MRTIKHTFNVDKLKICYIQPPELWQLIQEYNTNDYIKFDCFKLHIIDDGRGKEKNDKPRVKIKANVILDENNILLGTFTFNNSNKYYGKCFFEFDNKALYTTSTMYMGKRFNHIITLDFVEEVLNLRKNNLTEIEIACDVNFNVIHNLLKKIKDYENYVTYLNGNIIQDETLIIQNYGEFFQRSRKKRERYPTIYISQKKEDSPKLKIYNKEAEILNESGKTYIQKWDRMEKTMYRIEISIRNEDFRKFLELRGVSCDIEGDIEALCLNLTDESYLYEVWNYITSRMLKFRTKNTYITLADICRGE